MERQKESREQNQAPLSPGQCRKLSPLAPDEGQENNTSDEESRWAMRIKTEEVETAKMPRNNTRSGETTGLLTGIMRVFSYFVDNNYPFR